MACPGVRAEDDVEQGGLVLGHLNKEIGTQTYQRALWFNTTIDNLCRSIFPLNQKLRKQSIY